MIHDIVYYSDFDRRMMNWARWMLSNGEQSYYYPIYFMTGATHRGDRSIPLINGEAVETDEAVCSLQARYQKCIRETYLWNFPVSMHCKRLGGISESTYYRWLEKGRIGIMEFISEKIRKAKWTQEQQRSSCYKRP